MAPTRSPRTRHERTPLPSPVNRRNPGESSTSIKGKQPLRKTTQNSVPKHYVGVRSPTPEWVTKPTNPRPRELSLSELECVRTLGAGAFGKVVVVRVKEREHPSRIDLPGSLFAMKIIKKRPIRRVDKIDSEEKNWERRGLAELPWNPFITGIVEAFSDHRNFYLMLELVPCGTLWQALRKRAPFDITTASFYFANIVCGLDFLHSFDVVHRDLKPENILMGPDGYLCIADFGYAKKENEDGEWMVLGTPCYMAPELIESQGCFGRSIDWWASGCILFEMLTMRIAFWGKTDALTHKKTQGGKYKWPKSIRIANNAKDLVAGLLKHNVEERLGSLGADDIKDHPWLSRIDWSKMESRQYLAPYIPPEPSLTETWLDKPLPQKNHVPGLHVPSPPIYLQHDNRDAAPHPGSSAAEPDLDPRSW